MTTAKKHRHTWHVNAYRPGQPWRCARCGYVDPKTVPSVSERPIIMRGPFSREATYYTEQEAREIFRLWEASGSEIVPPGISIESVTRGRFLTPAGYVEWERR